MAQSSISSLSNIWNSVKSVFDLSSYGHHIEAIGGLADLGAHIGRFFGFGFVVTSIIQTLWSKRLKPHQKIIPLLSYGIFGIFSLATTIAVCTAATVFIPPLIFVASIVNVFRDVGHYFVEKAERNNLRKKFKDKETLHQTIEDCLLPPRLENDFKAFLDKDHFEPQDIQDLYVRLAYNFINKYDAKQKELSALIHQEQIGPLSHEQKSALRKEIKQRERELKQLFIEENEPLFKLVEKKQRLHYLNKSVKGRLLNVFYSSVVAVVAIVASGITIAAAVTPAAPVMPIVVGCLGAAGGVFSGAAAYNATKIAVQSSFATAKTATPRQAVESGVYPSLRADEESRPEEKARAQVLYKKTNWQRFKEKFAGLFIRSKSSKQITSITALTEPTATSEPTTLSESNESPDSFGDLQQFMHGMLNDVIKKGRRQSKVGLIQAEKKNLNRRATLTSSYSSKQPKTTVTEKKQHRGHVVIDGIIKEKKRP